MGAFKNGAATAISGIGAIISVAIIMATIVFVGFILPALGFVLLGVALLIVIGAGIREHITGKGE